MIRKDSVNYSKGKLTVGYGVIGLLIGAIVFLYSSEWRQLEKLEQEVKHINVLRQKVHDAYAKKLELAMYGETILEWEATDTMRYRTKRLQLDSLLCEFKQDYPPHRLDSLRRLLEDKESQLFNNTFDEFDWEKRNPLAFARGFLFFPIVPILTCHFTYFTGRRNNRYATLSNHILRKPKPRHTRLGIVHCQLPTGYQIYTSIEGNLQCIRLKFPSVFYFSTFKNKSRF